MNTSTSFAAASGAPVTAAPLPARVSWVLFDWAVQPFYTLIVTFLFAPYFANVIVGDADKGQPLWFYAAAVAGVIVAVGSPFLGALADGRGRRKPWIALLSVILAAALGSLWIGAPGASMTTILLVLLAYVCASAAAEFIAVFTNAIMPSLVPREQLGRLSGTGWAVGYAGGLAALFLVAGWGVDDRLVGPLSALWYLVFMAPFFLFVPDFNPVPRALGAPSALAELWDTLRELPAHRDMLYFLVARMLYTDGLAAIFLSGGIYGRAVFGWESAELALFGITVIATGIAGAFIGGFIDDRIGPKRVIVGALLLLVAGAAGILSVDKTHVLYTIEVAEKVQGSPPFSSTGELVFLGFAILIGMISAPVGAASRSLLARLAPPEKITQYFGLFAFSGKATAFLAPLLIAIVTSATGDQRIGMATIVLFLLAGVALMTPVRVPRD